MLTSLLKVTLLLALSAMAMAGCRSGTAATERVSESPDDETDWFCQEDGDSGEWKCIQDDELARNPDHSRPPQ